MTDSELKTTYYLIRHAEKDRNDSKNKNPHLTEEGLERAENWAEYFQEIPLDEIYSTDYVRTKETATPTAKAKDLDIKTYDSDSLYTKTFQQNTKGKTVLIVGHSDTTPKFANKIIGKSQFEAIEDSVNGMIFQVSIDKDGPHSSSFKTSFNSKASR